jgi:ubiquinone/menaquinone biosynthesis C-methylase UbiE
LKDSKFTVTDISPHAIKSIVNWEKLFKVKIDKYYSAKSYKLSENDNQFDLIFCYAAAHHFVLYEETLIELKRVLKDDGHIIFLYEPTSSKLFYPLHYYYVDKVAHHTTPEDVLIPSKIKSICSKIKIQYINQYDPNQIIIRNMPIKIYFSLLKRAPFLQRFLPSSSDLLFSKFID